MHDEAQVHGPVWLTVVVGLISKLAVFLVEEERPYPESYGSGQDVEASSAKVFRLAVIISPQASACNFTDSPHTCARHLATSSARRCGPFAINGSLICLSPSRKLWAFCMPCSHQHEYNKHLSFRGHFSTEPLITKPLVRGILIAVRS